MQVKCNFCESMMERDEFITHLKEEHAVEVIEELLTFSDLMELAEVILNDNKFRRI